MHFLPLKTENLAKAGSPLKIGLAILGLALGVAPALGQAVVAPAKPATKQPASKLGNDWVRFLKDDRNRPAAIQTATVRYTGKHAKTGQPVIVDLIGAVHVGDADYYRQLNKQFTQYDALLYELVAPPGTIVQPGQKASDRSALGAVQNGMKTMLELEHQLELVDYSRPNFVHADMSPTQFFDSMKNRDEGIVQMYFKMLGAGIAAQSSQAVKGESTDMQLMMALFAPDRARQLKIAMGKQLAETESLLSGFGGEQGSTIITERNKIALKVLVKQLDAGKRRLGIFYGAGHLEDMHERLVGEFGLQPQRVEWLTAWDLTEK